MISITHIYDGSRWLAVSAVDSTMESSSGVKNKKKSLNCISSVQIYSRIRSEKTRNRENEEGEKEREEEGEVIP